jgi:hypothetical protein
MSRFPQEKKSSADKLHLKNMNKQSRQCPSSNLQDSSFLEILLCDVVSDMPMSFPV